MNKGDWERVHHPKVSTSKKVFAVFLAIASVLLSFWLVSIGRQPFKDLNSDYDFSQETVYAFGSSRLGVLTISEAAPLTVSTKIVRGGLRLQVVENGSDTLVYDGPLDEGSLTLHLEKNVYHVILFYDNYTGRVSFDFPQGKSQFVR